MEQITIIGLRIEEESESLVE
uniref:Uncharacterized protein n=1 Tax=Rhizophora mucronata TaxID=61149 RepID=A0A2P2Q2G2_RHIMU